MRPEKLWELCEHGNFECWEKRDLGINVTPTMVRCKGAREASPVDLLAVVRRGVESGEVEGEVVDSVSFAGVVGPDWEFHTSKPGRYLVVRLDDGECKHDWYRSVDAPPDTCLKCGAKENRG